MKKAIFGFAATALLILLSVGVISAHPPKDVKLTWNPNGELTVRVAHTVNDPKKHYIYKIMVYVDDKNVAQHEFSAQDSPDGLTYTFPLGPQQSGASIKAEAFCVIMGSAVGSLSVP